MSYPARAEGLGKYLYTRPPHEQDVTKCYFLAESHRFEFSVFLLLYWLPYEGWRAKSNLLFTYSWRENNWIHTFPKCISAMWKASILVQDLNSGRWVHFQPVYTYVHAWFLSHTYIYTHAHTNTSVCAVTLKHIFTPILSHTHTYVHQRSNTTHICTHTHIHPHTQMYTHALTQTLICTCLFGFYGISTFVGYLTPNPFLCKWIDLFQTIQFSISTQFDCQKRFYFKLLSLVKQF